MSRLLWRLAERQVERHLPSEGVAPALGDLFEDYAKRETSVGRLRASWWLVKEVRSLTLAYRQRPRQMGWIYDVQSALTSFRRSRGTALAAILTLALGTGANTAILAVAYSVLLRPLPFAAPDRLVVIDTASRVGRPVNAGIPLTEVEDWRRRLPDVDGIAAFTTADLTVRGLNDPTIVHALLVTGDFFGVLGIPPAVGAPFRDSRATTVVVADRYARRMTSLPEILGRGVTVGGVPFQIGAVMPPAFAFPDDDVEMWVPAESIGDLVIFGTADSRTYRLIVRLPPGVPIERLRQEAQRVLQDLHPDKTELVATVDPLLEMVAGSARPVLAVFVAAVALLLLVACANVAMLLVGRAEARGRELAVRLALGASPVRLVRGALVETAVLAGTGSALGVAVACAGLRLFTHAASRSLPRVSAVTLDWPVLGAALLVAVLVTLASGLAPAVAAARTDFAVAFRQTSSPSSVGGIRRIRSLLVVLQVAVAIVLLAGGGLFARTVMGLLRGHGGVAPDHVVTSRLVLTEGTRFNATGSAGFVETLLERVRALPGVQAAGIGSNLPPRHNQLALQVSLGSGASGRNTTVATDLVAVTPGYLEVLGVRLEQGRLFDEHDAQSAATVAILSEGAARDFYGHRKAVDRDFLIALPTAAGPPVRPRVIGIVSDVQYSGLDASARGNVYVLWQNLSAGVCYLVVRTAGDPSALEAALQPTVHDLDPGLPLLDVRSLDDEMNLAIAGRELRLWLVAAFAGLAFAVALVGLSATLARSVTERRRELAIRSALGATPQDVMALVGTHGVALVTAGLAVGLGAAAASGRWVASLLSGVSPYDPATYGAVAGIVLVSAALACYLPARRAAKVDPLELLRVE